MERVISFLGLFVMMGLAWLMSSHKRKISLRIVGGGLFLVLGVVGPATVAAGLGYCRFNDLCRESVVLVEPLAGVAEGGG